MKDLSGTMMGGEENQARVGARKSNSPNGSKLLLAQPGQLENMGWLPSPKTWIAGGSSR